MLLLRTFVISALFFSACGDDDPTPVIDAATGGADAPTGGPDAGGGGFELLVGADWTLQPGTESYTCARVTIAQDTYIKEFRPVIPVGTHHTVLTVEPPGTGPDGIFPCDAGTNGSRMIYGSGVGTNGMRFPDGVAVKVAAGEQLMLNLHLYNVDDAPLSGTSAIEVIKVPAAEVVFEAGILESGKITGLTVAPGVTTQTGQCNITQDLTIFSVAPHMHRLGVHSRTSVRAGGTGTPVMLLDVPYNFEAQLFHPLDVGATFQAQAGDVVDIECTYDNPGSSTISFGDSSDAEMCFSALYHYPASGAYFICAN